MKDGLATALLIAFAPYAFALGLLCSISTRKADRPSSTPVPISSSHPNPRPSP